MHVRSFIARLPLALRALVLLPLLSAAVDQARVSLVCGPDVRSCLETAGGGRFGLAALGILALYTSAIAALMSRVARRRKAPAALWVVATAGVYGAIGGQALLAEILGGGPAMLGGDWLHLVAFAAAGGAVLAFALRVLPAAREHLIHRLAPRLRPLVETPLVGLAPAAVPALPRFARFARDRAPPALA